MGVVLAVLGELRRLLGVYNNAKSRIAVSPGIPVENSTKSFWMHPPSKIAKYQSSIADDSEYDIVVIGSGLSGLSVAKYVLESRKFTKGNGPKVLMLEAREACSGATGRNGGHIWPTIFEEYVDLKDRFGQDDAKKIAKLRMMHIDAYKQVIEKSNRLDLGGFCQLRDVEAVEVSMHPDTWKERKRKFNIWKQALGSESPTWSVYESQEAVEKFRLAANCCGVISGVNAAAAMWPYRFVTALLEELLSSYPNNFYLMTESPCADISTVDDRYLVRIGPGKSIRAQCIVHATNGHVSHLVPKMREKIIPVRATMSTQRPGQALNNSTLNGKRSYSFIGATNGFDYLTQLPSGERELMFGGGFGHANSDGFMEMGISKDDSFDADIAGYLNGALPTHFGFENWGREAEVQSNQENFWHSGRTKAMWTGTLGWSADGLPWVGRVPDALTNRNPTRGNEYSGEWLIAGFSGEGMTSAWMCGQALGEMLLSNGIDANIDWFPQQLKFTEKRWHRAKPEDQLQRSWGH